MENFDIVVGQGEVGKALKNVLSTYHEVFGIDADPEKSELVPRTGHCRVLHICFPPSETFVEQVKAYQAQWKPKYTVIHSSVAIGTSEQLGAYHSPVRGVHPNLEGGLKTFLKYLGVPKGTLDTEDTRFLQDYFAEVKINTFAVDGQSNSEALKLLDTTYYGWNIIFEKLVYEFCEKNGLDYETIYKHANESYNAGYKKLDRLDVIRPVLKHMDGAIGGHCVLQNLELFNTPVNDFIREQNERFALPKVQKDANED